MKAKIKSLTVTILLNACLLFTAYQFLYLHSEGWENVFRLFTYIWCPLVFLIGAGISQYKKDDLKEMAENWKKRQTLPHWVYLMPDAVIIGNLAYNGFMFLSVLWIMYVFGQVWMVNAFKKNTDL